MADFALEKSAPFDGCDLPQSLGAARLAAVAMGGIIAVMPLKGQSMAVAGAMKSAFGVTLPKVGEIARASGVELLWFAQGQWLVINADLQKLTAMQNLAAISDQSDGWAMLHLDGADAKAVLARLCPLDFDAVRVGCVARTEFAHIPAMIIPREDGYWIGLPRSFATTAYENIIDTMKSVAAQALL